MQIRVFVEYAASLTISSLSVLLRGVLGASQAFLSAFVALVYSRGWFVLLLFYLWLRFHSDAAML